MANGNPEYKHGELDAKVDALDKKIDDKVGALDTKITEGFAASKTWQESHERKEFAHHNKNESFQLDVIKKLERLDIKLDNVVQESSDNKQELVKQDDRIDALSARVWWITGIIAAVFALGILTQIISVPLNADDNNTKEPARIERPAK